MRLDLRREGKKTFTIPFMYYSFPINPFSLVLGKMHVGMYAAAVGRQLLYLGMRLNLVKQLFLDRLTE